LGHSRAKLTSFGRQLLVERVECLGWPAAQAAEALGISRSTAYKWVRRFRQEGIAGLEDRSSRPQRCPQQLSPSQEQRILEARQRLKIGPHQLSHQLCCPRSTIYAVLRRNGFSRLRDADRPSGAPVRYVRERPGELLHLDVKKLGRIPESGGHRALGREEGMKKKHRMGNEFVHVAVDDASVWLTSRSSLMSGATLVRAFCSQRQASSQAEACVSSGYSRTVPGHTALPDPFPRQSVPSVPSTS